jgi:hypothetical protein
VSARWRAPMAWLDARVWSDRALPVAIAPPPLRAAPRLSAALRLSARAAFRATSIPLAESASRAIQSSKRGHTRVKHARTRGQSESLAHFSWTSADCFWLPQLAAAKTRSHFRPITWHTLWPSDKATDGYQNDATGFHYCDNSVATFGEPSLCVGLQKTAFGFRSWPQPKRAVKRINILSCKRRSR